jgi:hypothetical protein
MNISKILKMENKYNNFIDANMESLEYIIDDIDYFRDTLESLTGKDIDLSDYQHLDTLYNFCDDLFPYHVDNIKYDIDKIEDDQLRLQKIKELSLFTEVVLNEIDSMAKDIIPNAEEEYMNIQEEIHDNKYLSFFYRSAR